MDASLPQHPDVQLWQTATPHHAVKTKQLYVLIEERLRGTA